LAGHVVTGRMGRERREHDDASRPHRNWNRTVRVPRALEADGRASVGERARTVEAGEYPDAAVVERGVGDRDPAREVGLRFDVRVAVVLVPEDRLRPVRLLVDGLVPVQPDIGPDEVVAQTSEQRRRTERTQRGGVLHEVQRNRHGVDAGEAEATLRLGAEELERPLVERRDLGVQLGDGLATERLLEDEEALLVVRAGLFLRDDAERPLVLWPLERGVPGMALEAHCCPARRQARPTAAVRSRSRLTTST